MKPKFCNLLILVAFVLVNVLALNSIAAPNRASRIIYATNLAQLDAVFAAAGGTGRPGDTKTPLVWQRSRFATDAEARKILDAIWMAQAWNVWIDANGNPHGGLNQKFSFLFDGSEPVVEPSARAFAIHEWAWPRFMKMRGLPEQVEPWIYRIPTELGFIVPLMEVIVMTYDQERFEKFYKESFSSRSHFIRTLAAAQRVSPRIPYDNLIDRGFAAPKTAKIFHFRTCQSLFSSVP